MAPAAPSPPSPPVSSALLLALLALLCPLAPSLVRAGETSSLEVTELPELGGGGTFESHADACMAEANVTHGDVHEAIEKNPDDPPQLIKCIWGCMFRKMGLLVDGEMPAAMPPDLSEEAAQEYDMMRSNCAEKVLAAADECEKGAVLKLCADENTTAHPITSSSQPPP